MRRVCLAAWFVATAAAQQKQLPDEPGKEALLRVCGPCHGAEVVIGHRNSREEWGRIVGEMVSYGAEGTVDELNQIVDYLAKNFPKQSQNKAHVGRASACNRL